MCRLTTLGVLLLALMLLTVVLGTQRPGYTQGQQNSSTNKAAESSTNKNANTGTGRGFGGIKAPPPGAAAPPTEDFSKATWDLPKDADKTVNPVQVTPESVAAGKELYFARAGNCVFCHGETGAGNEENLPRLRRKPADLSNKTRMSKISDGEIFWKMTLGIPGIMPGREKQLTEEQRWHVVNYVRTLGQEKPMN